MSSGSLQGPKYLVVASQLARELSRMTPGTRAPSEHELARKHGVNRLTAKAALDELERQHLVRRVQGHGTYVTHRLEYRITRNSPPSWSQTVREAGGTPTIETERLHRQARASRDVQRFLRVGPDDPVYHLKRRRFVDGLIAACTDSYLPEHILPDFESQLDRHGSLHQLLTETYIAEPVRTWVRVELLPAPPTITKRLDLKGTPMLHVLRSQIVSKRLQCPIEYGTTWLRPDAFDVVVELDLTGVLPE